MTGQNFLPPSDDTCGRCEVKILGERVYYWWTVHVVGHLFNYGQDGRTDIFLNIFPEHDKVVQANALTQRDELCVVSTFDLG